MTTLEHDLTSTSELFQRLIQQSTPLQNEWQQAEKKLAELKMMLEQKQALFNQNTESLVKLETQKIQTKERIQLIELQLDTLQAQLDEYAENLQSAEADSQQRVQVFADLKAQQQQAQQQYELIKVQVEKQQQQKAQMQAQMEQLSKNVQRIEQQKNTLKAQAEQVQKQCMTDDLSQLEQDQSKAQREITQLEQNIALTKTHIEQTQEHVNLQKAQISALKSEIQVLQSEQKNLNQLTAKSAVKTSENAVQLMQILKLNEQGKAQASLVEKFLAKWLSAYIVDPSASFQDSLARQLKSSTSQEKIQLQELPCLADWIESPQYSLWNQVAIAENLIQALSLQQQLIVGQSLLTLDGYHVGQDWVIGLFFDESSQAAQGALSHRIRLEEIEFALELLQPQLTDVEAALPSIQHQLAELQKQIQADQTALKTQQNTQQQVSVQIAKQQSATQAFELQKIQLNSQLQQLDEQLEEDAMQKDDLEIDLHSLSMKLEQHLPEYKTLQYKLDELNEQVEEQQQQLQYKQQDVEASRRMAEQNKQQIELLDKDLNFSKVSYQQILQQMEQAHQFIDPIQLELPSLERQYAEQADQAEKLQKTWADWQVELHNVQSRQQQLTELRLLHQQNDEQLRTQLEAKRLAWQSAKSDLQHYSDQLKEMNADIQLGLSIDLPTHQQNFEKAQRQFEKLGAVNLAASEEYEEVSKRFDELTHQIQDLENTVEQLRDAMKSIDQETRKLFMTTFDQVNAELQNLFPKVFNGGEATLSLEDDWQSGVRLMARPPGKKNSSLALLSGGEKALTALALVFAIFRLNPAPFCVLDEVDAPLDDANVGRFCNLVKELSEQVQFIYITHNKVAMTMATDLLGVTMPEPGTSKLVTVNLEEAREYGLAAEF